MKEILTVFRNVREYRQILATDMYFTLIDPEEEMF
jgi:hypothetical protein